MSQALVSCLMVTANRPELARRAIDCFARQDWENRELIIVDDGEIDYSPIIESSVIAERITYHRLHDGRHRTLGELRNLSMEVASGRWMAQWDDDEWYHPSRISAQMCAASVAGAGASALRWTLASLVDEKSNPMEFRCDSGIATPGTILFHAGSYRYPNLRKNEDGVFLRQVRDNVGLAVLGEQAAYLFVRVHHGENTWDRNHFISKLRRTPASWPAWIWAKYIKRDITTLSNFALTKNEITTLNEMRAWDAWRDTLEYSRLLREMIG